MRRVPAQRARHGAAAVPAQHHVRLVHRARRAHLAPLPALPRGGAEQHARLLVSRDARQAVPESDVMI